MHTECHIKISALMVTYKSVKSYLITFPWLQAVHDAKQSGGIEQGITVSALNGQGKHIIATTLMNTMHGGSFIFGKLGDSTGIAVTIKGGAITFGQQSTGCSA
jgi:hypothetical protein